MIAQAWHSTSEYKIDGVSLTGLMAALLLDHAAGPRATRALPAEWRGLRSLRARKLIRFNGAIRPTHSIATVRGRESLPPYWRGRPMRWLRETMKKC
jgi:hypothetical protein